MQPRDEPYIPPRRSWPRKIAAALHGCYLGSRGQSSFLVHIPAALAVVLAAAAWQVSPLEWCVLSLSIAIVLAAELGNSALETLAKAVVRAENPHIAQALDIASGAVLVAAAGAAATGLIILAPRFVGLLPG